MPVNAILPAFLLSVLSMLTFTAECSVFLLQYVFVTLPKK